MKKVIVALALASAACVAPAFAGNVGFTISVGEPGFYGQLVLGDRDRPLLVNARPVIHARGYGWASPVYVRVPDWQRRNWGRYCSRYSACARPVYFVRDDWYRDEYAPRYRRDHDRYRHDGRSRDWRQSGRHERREYRDHDRHEYRGNSSRDGRGHRDRGDRHDRGRDDGRRGGGEGSRSHGRH
jgi:hypothetical protein